jgi:hypothetical protein
MKEDGGAKMTREDEGVGRCTLDGMRERGSHPPENPPAGVALGIPVIILSPGHSSHTFHQCAFVPLPV